MSVARPIRRVLVANRGEIALRVMRTLRELGKGTVAVYSDADAAAPHVLFADAAVRLGPAPAAESYLRGDLILEAARTTGADALHPGYGLLSENATFAAQVQDAGLTWIGPPPSAMRAMASKTAARATMVAAGVPVVPGGAITDVAQVGFPLLVKASAGGGGKGMRRVDRPEDVAEAILAAQGEARRAFGDAHVYLERLVLRPRHVEIQVLADQHGHVVSCFERECSIQRRHQKVIEESPSPVLHAETRERMGAAAVAAARAVGYVNAGTCEFLLETDPHTGEQRFYFLEMNTRLQVEHPVTELVIGKDLVAEQVRIAEGAPLGYGQRDLAQRGHAIEARLYAEDPHTQLPQTGRVARLRFPEGPGVRVDSGLVEGGEVTPYYDPMLAKVCAFAETRDAATARLARALRELVLLGVTTNVPLLLHVLEHPAFAAGDTTTAFLEEHPVPVGAVDDLALIAAALAGAPVQAAVGDARQDPWSPFTRLGSFRP